MVFKTNHTALFMITLLTALSITQFVSSASPEGTVLLWSIQQGRSKKSLPCSILYLVKPQPLSQNPLKLFINTATVVKAWKPQKLSVLQNIRAEVTPAT
ncbi:MAG TPA: hypothetical protein VGT41_01405 [Candidatus Babeliales bacterium]|nr:hypothetical protein [Candidatus Babeliales bacterium]